MSFTSETLLLGAILSADSFSAAVAMGFRPFSRREALRFAFTSGGAEAFVAWLGVLAGIHILSKISAYDHWVAFALLMAVSLNMLFEGISGILNRENHVPKVSFHNPLKVIAVSFATSLDALGVGLGYGIKGNPVVPFLLSIGIWAFVSTILGLYLARRLSKKFGPIITLIGALVLGLLSFQMLKI